VDSVRLGLAFRALRRRRGWTQAQLAEQARVSRGAIQRVERGGAEDFTGALVRRMAVALGARFEQRLLWQGEALDRLLDADHARLVDIVVRWLRDEGWDVAPEATFAIAGERGSIDVMAFHAATGTLLVVEVKTVVPDMQAMLSGIDRKARVARSVARARGWDARVVARLLVLPDDRTSRRRVELQAATLDAALPARTRAVAHWIPQPVGTLAGILFLTDAAVSGARHRVARGGGRSRA